MNGGSSEIRGRDSVVLVQGGDNRNKEKALDSTGFKGKTKNFLREWMLGEGGVKDLTSLRTELP